MSNSSINMTVKKDMSDFILKARGSLQRAMRNVLTGVSKRLVDYSIVGDPALWKHRPPKGYRPGHFINNWQLGVDGNVPIGEIPGVDASGQGSLRRMIDAIPQWPLDKTFNFVNNVPYAAALEYGHHSLQVPPGGMMGRVKLEFKQIVRDAQTQLDKGL